MDELVEKSKRQEHFPLRREFVQRTYKGKRVPGPLSAIVSAGDRRGLILYLLLLTKASAKPWDSTLPAAAWARALGLPLPETATARSTISKIWLRLERHKLVRRTRSERLACVTLLRDDGSGKRYTSPGEVGEGFAPIPLALWLQGPDASHRWYDVLTLPELAVILIARTRGDAFRLPYESAPEWYGISADTLARGVKKLNERGLLRVDQEFKKAPLSAVGYTAEHRYTLLDPFGPMGFKSGSATRRRKSGTSPRKAPTTTAKKRASAPPTRRRRASPTS